ERRAQRSWRSRSFATGVNSDLSPKWMPRSCAKIGLTPADINYARGLPLTQDPTLALARLIDERQPRHSHSSKSEE
ncbi:hypothetical protein, partial [Hypericibacter sp.]|uniref:hypothetical protein n=1 Tax=Hypericibacter sp. TaxID=2705401 RepID=UPI003D6CF673